MKEVVASGRTVEDAKNEAMKELGVDSLKEVEVEVIDEGSKGVFGWGTKYARVRVRLLEEAKKPVEKKPIERKPVERKPVERKPVERKPVDKKPVDKKPIEKKPVDKKPRVKEVPPPPPIPIRKPDPNERRRNSFLEPAGTHVAPPIPQDFKKPVRPRYENKRTEKKKTPPPPTPPRQEVAVPKPQVAQVPAISPDSPFAPEKIINRMLELMNLKADIEKSRSNGNDLYSINGTDLGVLIGKHGQTLEALQFIINLIILRKTESKKKITIDVEGYRARREKSLRELARRLAEKAKRERRKVVLEPMLPSERRIIHITLQKNPYISTYSQGEEPMRRVIISPKRQGR